jgi:hypothetical protein
VDSPSARSRLGTFWLAWRAETLVVIQALERADAEEALAALP